MIVLQSRISSETLPRNYLQFLVSSSCGKRRKRRGYYDDHWRLTVRTCTLLAIPALSSSAVHTPTDRQ